MPYMQINNDKILSVSNEKIKDTDVFVDTYDTAAYKYNNGVWAKDPLYVPPVRTGFIIETKGK